MTTGNEPGPLMRAESAEAAASFRRAATQPINLDLPRPRAIYTIARGSSDAAATILSYSFMAHLGLPVTSLPPSVFSLGRGVGLTDAMALVISQSGGSDDLVAGARGARAAGATVIAITNADGSRVEEEATRRLSILAGPELAVPATKSVIGAVGAGLALLAAMAPATRPALDAAVSAFSDAACVPRHDALETVMTDADSVFVIGRGAGFGAAQEIALKLKETCAIHAEAYSASEVLHGPMQLAVGRVLVLLLDTGQPEFAPSLDMAETRFTQLGRTVVPLRPRVAGLDQAAAAALLLDDLYPAIRRVALARGHDPDAPQTLAKITRTL